MRVRAHNPLRIKPTFGHTLAQAEEQSHECQGHTLPLTFVAINGQRLSVPMIHMQINGEPTLLIVDSGASHHVLTRAQARRSGIHLTDRTDVGQGHAGRSLHTTELPRFELGTGDDDESFIDGAVAIDSPPPFEHLGIGGGFSPQRAYGCGWVVLDMAHEVMRVVSTANEARALVGGERVLAIEFRNQKPYATFHFGREAVVGELDTGAGQSELEEAVVGSDASLNECGDAVGVSGECIRGGEVRDQSLTFAGYEFAGLTILAKETIEYGGGPDENALLGNDVLAHCIFALPVTQLGAHEIPVRCSPPTNLEPGRP